MRQRFCPHSYGIKKAFPNNKVQDIINLLKALGLYQGDDYIPTPADYQKQSSSVSSNILGSLAVPPASSIDSFMDYSFLDESVSVGDVFHVYFDDLYFSFRFSPFFIILTAFFIIRMIVNLITGKKALYSK